MRAISERLINRFDEEVGLHYNYKHRKQGYIEATDEHGMMRQIPLMSLSIGVLTSQDGPFYDIRELSETFEEARQKAAALAREHKRSAMFQGRSH
ncbi:MAG: hypothetical protein HC893_16960 [Chloroflexaceae bacterium]|nr:hypothetical protein [Chloroflexaceae bacterium]